MPSNEDEKYYLDNIETIVKNPINIFLLVATVSFSIMTLIIWPAIIGLALELLYIGICLAVRRIRTSIREQSRNPKQYQGPDFTYILEWASASELGQRLAPIMAHLVKPFLKSKPIKLEANEDRCALENSILRSDDINTLIKGFTKLNLYSLDPIYREIDSKLYGDLPYKQELIREFDSLHNQYRNLITLRDKMHKHLLDLLDDSLVTDDIFPNLDSDLECDLQERIYKSFAENKVIDDITRYEEWVRKIILQIHHEYEHRLRKLALAHKRAVVFDIIDINPLTKVIQKRNSFSEKIGCVIMNICFELQLICARLSLISYEINVRSHDQIVTDLKSLDLHIRSLLHTVNVLDSRIAVINHDDKIRELGYVK